jgi:hypothetical protein
MRQPILKKLLEARKKLLTKMTACDNLIWLSLETATKKKLSCKIKCDKG